MFNFEQMLSDFAKYAYEQPVIITAIFAALVGLFYYLGWIINSNNWQYQNSTREGHIYRGFFFISSHFFLPAVVIIALISLLGIESSLIGFFKFIPILIHYGLLVVIFIFLFENLDSRIYNEIRKFETRPLIKSLLVNSGGLNYIFILLNIAIVVSLEKISENVLLLLILVWLDIWILARWARLSSLYHQSAEAKLKLIGNSEMDVRLIEFIEKGSLLKVQLIEKETEKVFAIPLERIEKIELLTKKQYTDLPFLTDLLKLNEEKDKIKEPREKNNSEKTKK